tara:strand:- start:36 stop:2366 length:2331 start_codon:yes stop_codon:yes gene_type:complete
MYSVGSRRVLWGLGVFCLGLLFSVIAGDAAQANSSWKLLRGHSACGAIDAAGNLQPACDYEPASFMSKAVGRCPAGSFFDIGTWSCYSCPTGFNRNARPVTSPKACDKAVPARTGRATFLGKVNCPSGSFIDGRNGGECWQCPSGYGRTAAAVDQWNACGMIGRKAVSAVFRGKPCPEGAIRDPRNGGECWKCPEDYQRTANPVTGANACKILLDFEPAVKKAALTCPAGQHFDFIDGGTCWSCPEGSTRTWFGVKTAKACRNKKMKWVVPTRTKYGLFGLGSGADDILAKMIAERTKIDDAVKAIALKAGEPAGPGLTKAWDVIDKTPWESPILSALLGKVVMEAATKPVSQRTATEKNLVDMVAKLIQWNRQFVAYQAKQAFDTYMLAANKANKEALSKMGAASIYAGGVIAPPDYNEVVAGAIQLTAAFAGPVGATVIPMMFEASKIALFPFSTAAREAGKMGLALASSGGNLAAAAAAPMAIAAAVSVVVIMEMDKLMKTEEMEGKIRQAIDISNRPVDIGLMLKQAKGPDEFLFHWGAVIGGNVQPSANFKTRLAAYKAGKDPDATSSPSSIDPSKIVITSTQTTPSTNTIDPSKIKIETIPSTTIQVNNNQTPTSAPSAVPQADKALIAAIKRQQKQPKGTLRFELSNVAGLCLSKSEGPTEAMVVADCKQQDTLWIAPDQKSGTLQFGNKYCVGTGDAQPGENTPVLISKCKNSPNMKWELQKDGHVKMLTSDFCMTATGKGAKGAAVVVQKCQTKARYQIWRPWTASK